MIKVGSNAPSLRANDNWGFFVLKILCAFGVVLLHAYPIWIENVLFHPFMRAAVPSFLLISGYYLVEDGVISMKRVAKQIRKVVYYIVLYNFLYFLLTVIIHAVDHSQLISDQYYSLSFWLRFVFVGNSICYPYWYLTAYLYALIFLRICGDKRILLYFSPFLCLLAVLFNRYSFLISPDELDQAWTTNALLCGLPGLVFGAYLKKNDIKIRQVPLSSIAKLFAIVCCLAYVEYFVLNYYNFGVYGGDYYLFTFPLAIALVILFLKLDYSRILITSNILNSVFRWVALLGKRHSTNVYLFHVWVISILGLLGRHCFNTDYLQLAECVFVLTILFSMLVISIRYAKITKVPGE